MFSMTNPTFSSQQLRFVAGAFATGITVVSIDKDDGSIQGMTANSFLSVSLDPALVLFSVDHKSSLSNKLHTEQSLGISILRHDQKALSDHFASRSAIEHDIPFVYKRACPILEDCIAWYATRIQSIIRVGDHDLIICEVQDCDRTEGDPLLYYKGYRAIGESI